MTNRERLIEATQDLLWERGYVGTSPKAIQERAGAGQGSMYHHFAGKADLALEAIRRSAAGLRAEAETSFKRDGTALARIEAYLRRKREVLRGCPVGRMAQDPEMISNPELRRPVEETFAWLQQRLSEILAQGQARGEFAHFDCDALATTIIAVLQGGYVLARAAHSTTPFDNAISGILALLAAQARESPQ